MAAARRLDLFDLVELLDPALHLGGVRGTRLESLDELDFLGQHGLLALVLRLALFFGQGALLFVEVEIARIGDQRPAVDFDDLADNAVQKGAVVRGHEKRAVVVLQERFQPDQAFQVQVVAGFVEQHAVRTHQQDTRQRHTHLPAAGQQADVTVHAFLAEAEAGQHFARPGLYGVAVQFLEARLNVAIAFDDLVHLVGLVRVDHGRLEPGHFRRQRADRADAIHHRGDSALARHFADVLAEIANGHAVIDADQAVVGLFAAGDHAEQGRLAGAVRSDKTHFLTLLDAHRGVDKQDLVAVLLGDIVEADHTGLTNSKIDATVE